MAKAKTTKKTATKKAAPKKEKILTRKWNVEAAKLDYMVDPTLTIADIAEKYGISKSMVQLESVKMHWSDLRIDYSQQVEKETRIALQAQREKTIKKHLSQGEAAAAAGANALQRLWDKIKDDPTAIPDVNKMNTAIDMMKKGQEMQRIALSLPTAYSGHIGKDGDLADPTAPTQQTNVVNLIQMLDGEIARAQRNGIIDGDIVG